MTPEALRAAIEYAAANHGLEANMVEALVLTESGGAQYAWNPEPRYPYVVDARTGKPFRKLTSAEAASKTPPADFRALAGDPDQEWWGQQASWGVCQIMGAVARELGFRGHYLPELVDPSLSLHYGCKHLAAHLAWAKGDVNRALEAYNGGRGSVGSAQTAEYVIKVRRNLGQVQGSPRRA